MTIILVISLVTNAILLALLFYIAGRADAAQNELEHMRWVERMHACGETVLEPSSPK